MNWNVEYLPEAVKDLEKMNNSQKLLVFKAINRVRANPLPINEGGYVKPLGNKNGKNLAGLLKIKLLNAGIRVVYKIVRTETRMVIIVIGARKDDIVYKLAEKRMHRNLS